MKEYLEKFDYNSRKEMKIQTPQMLELVLKNEAIVIDVRFKEEYDCWNLKFMKSIPLNELPNRLNELAKDKLIITACPHSERSNIARQFLISQGFRAKHLSDGILKTTTYLLGDNAKDFMDKLNQ